MDEEQKTVKKIDDTYIIIASEQEAKEHADKVAITTKRNIDIVNPEKIKACVNKISEMSKKLIELRKTIEENPEHADKLIDELSAMSKELVSECSSEAVTMLTSDILTIKKPEDIEGTISHLEILGKEKPEEEVLDEELREVLEE